MLLKAYLREKGLTSNFPFKFLNSPSKASKSETLDKLVSSLTILSREDFNPCNFL